MSKTQLWTRAAEEMRKDADPRWHTVADWLRTEAVLQDEMQPFADLINAAIEQESGIKGYLRFGRDKDGDVHFVADANEAATAVAMAYLDGDEPNPPCAWCPEPAGEQIHMSTDDNGRRQYAWLCDRCADAAKTKKETRS